MEKFNSLFVSLSNLEKVLKKNFGLFMLVIIRKILKSGLYSSQDSINDSTVDEIKRI